MRLETGSFKLAVVLALLAQGVGWKEIKKGDVYALYGYMSDEIPLPDTTGGFPLVEKVLASFPFMRAVWDTMASEAWREKTSDVGLFMTRRPYWEWRLWITKYVHQIDVVSMEYSSDMLEVILLDVKFLFYNLDGVFNCVHKEIGQC